MKYTKYEYNYLLNGKNIVVSVLTFCEKKETGIQYIFTSDIFFQKNFSFDGARENEEECPLYIISAQVNIINYLS